MSTDETIEAVRGLLFGAGLGFADAVEIEPGMRVRVGGYDRTVTAVKRSGKDWPYFQVEPGGFSFAPEWVSWQRCGQADSI